MGIARSKAVQDLLDLFESPHYLEIGVNLGETFHAVKAAAKVAVDPRFLFDTGSSEDPSAVYHEVTSDEYFGRIIEPDSRFHVIYLDGLHTAEQTFRDFLNAILFLRDDGVILIDDVRPNSHISAIADHKRYIAVRDAFGSTDRSWMGDVFRSIYVIDTFVQQFSVRITSDNHGQAVVWRARRRSVPERTIVGAGSKSFDDLIAERPFPTAPLASILEEIRQVRGRC